MSSGRSGSARWEVRLRSDALTHHSWQVFAGLTALQARGEVDLRFVVADRGGLPLERRRPVGRGARPRTRRDAGPCASTWPTAAARAGRVLGSPTWCSSAATASTPATIRGRTPARRCGRGRCRARCPPRPDRRAGAPLRPELRLPNRPRGSAGPLQPRDAPHRRSPRHVVRDVGEVAAAAPGLAAEAAAPAGTGSPPPRAGLVRHPSARLPVRGRARRRGRSGRAVPHPGLGREGRGRRRPPHRSELPTGRAHPHPATAARRRGSGVASRRRPTPGSTSPTASRTSPPNRWPTCGRCSAAPSSCRPSACACRRPTRSRRTCPHPGPS